MVSTHREAIEAAEATEIVVLDSPFGFQENVEQLTERLVSFFETSLSVTAVVASLRERDPRPIDVERFRNQLGAAKALFAGPGSPSYALGVWQRAAAGPLLDDVVRRGGSVTLASAAALTAGLRTIPVYEIYKVGAEPHWLEGLDLLARFGLRATVVPHWNNSEGGNHDTSRCYIGERRLAALETELDHGIIGVDEHTAVTFDLSTRRMAVTGKGTVTLRADSQRVLEPGEQLDLAEAARLLGRAGPPPAPRELDGRPARGFQDSLLAADADGVIAAMLAVEERINDDPGLRRELRSMIVQLGDAARRGLVDPHTVVGGYVELLLDLRRDARTARRFTESDRIRDGLADLGVEVRDTEHGVEWALDSEIGDRERQNP